MRFKTDENLPREVTGLFEAAGHDSVSIYDQHLGRRPDESIAEVCRMEERAQVTLDLDFADIRTYPPKDYPGLIVLRLSRQDKGHVLEVVARLMGKLDTEPVNKHLWIVEESAVRIRGDEAI